MTKIEGLARFGYPGRRETKIKHVEEGLKEMGRKKLTSSVRRIARKIAFEAPELNLKAEQLEFLISGMFLKYLVKELKEGKEVNIGGLGRMTMKRGMRIVMNPRTKEKFEKEILQVKFHPYKRMKELLKW